MQERENDDQQSQSREQASTTSITTTTGRKQKRLIDNHNDDDQRERERVSVSHGLLSVSVEQQHRQHHNYQRSPQLPTTCLAWPCCARPHRFVASPHYSPSNETLTRHGMTCNNSKSPARRLPRNNPPYGQPTNKPNRRGLDVFMTRNSARAVPCNSTWT